MCLGFGVGVTDKHAEETQIIHKKKRKEEKHTKGRKHSFQDWNRNARVTENQFETVLQKTVVFKLCSNEQTPVGPGPQGDEEAVLQVDWEDYYDRGTRGMYLEIELNVSWLWFDCLKEKPTDQGYN